MQGPRDPIHVLHVDADRDFVKLVAEHLEREYERISVQSVTSAPEGLDYLQSADIDCIIAGYSLPDQTGVEFLETVRETFPNLPFILFPTKWSEEIVRRAIDAGVTDFLPLGSDPDQFSLLAERILDTVDEYREAKQAKKLERINTVIRDINRELVRASTQEEIDQGVCEVISNAEPYVFAWIGERDEDSDQVKNRAAAGIEEGYLKEIIITTNEEPRGQGPTGKAIRTGKMAVMQNIPEDPRYKPWREQALERGFQSSAAIPLVYDETLYGVLNVYANRTGAFGTQERELLQELSKTIAKAYLNVELTEKLKDRTDQYKAVLENVHDGLVIIQEGVITFVNERLTEMSGYSSEELIGEQFLDFVVEEYQQTVLERHQARMQGEVPTETYSIELRRRGQDPLPVEVSVGTFEYEGETASIIAIRDISGRVDRTRQLQVMDRILRHNLRNDMTTIQGNAEMIKDEVEGIEEEIQIIIETGRNFMRTVDKGREIVDVIAEQRQPERVDIVDICYPVVHSLRESYPNATIKLECPPSAYAMTTAKFGRVIEELLENAIIHNDMDPPKVSLTVEPRGEKIQIEVADNGPGIPEEEVNVLTREQDIDPLYHGNGLGLKLVNWIVNHSEGTLTFEENEPRGSIVRIELQQPA